MEFKKKVFMEVDIMMTKYEYETYTEWCDNCYRTVTKVFDTEKVDTTWSGCHWDNPAIIKAETVEGETWSDEMSDFIHKVGAIDNDY